MTARNADLRFEVRGSSLCLKPWLAQMLAFQDLRSREVGSAELCAERITLRHFV
ncbi:MAG: hypothetical protein WB819_08075 [Terriglobia bacterium]